MRLCIVGIGGTGGKVSREFLEDGDLNLKGLVRWTCAKPIVPGGIKGIWLESDKNDAENKQSFFKDGRRFPDEHPLFYIPHDIVPDGHPVHVGIKERYGYDIKKQGYVRDAQYLKAIYEIFETDDDIRSKAADLGYANPIFGDAWRSISCYTTLGGGKCDGILFIISLGGGTGTGFINPIVQHIRSTGKGDYPVFVLGVLTEEGTTADTEQFARGDKRNLGAISSIYDLITRDDGVDGLILVDNQILMKRCGGDYISINRFLYSVCLPMIAARDYPGEMPPSPAVRAFCKEGLKPSLPPILIPCYSSMPRQPKPEAALVDDSLNQGRLFGCEPEKADRVIVFCRGYLDSKKIREAFSKHIPHLKDDDIAVWRKLGDCQRNEMLILLRNPYGTPGAYSKGGTFEDRLCRVTSTAIEYIDDNRIDLLHLKSPEDDQASDNQGKDHLSGITSLTRSALESYFYGDRGLKDELERALERLEHGKKPLFTRPLKIFNGQASHSEGASNDCIDPLMNGIFTESQMRCINQMIRAEVERINKPSPP